MYPTRKKRSNDGEKKRATNEGIPVFCENMQICGGNLGHIRIKYEFQLCEIQVRPIFGYVRF